MNVKLHFNCKRIALVGFTLALCAYSFPARGQAPILNGSFEFGPGTPNAVRDSVTLSVPARTTVTVGVLLQRNLAGPNGRPLLADIDVTIDVLKPDGSVASSQPATASFFNAGVAIPVIPMPGFFTSQSGCPSTWRVRVQTKNSTVPAARIFGTVTYGYLVPGTINLDLEGDPVSINAGASVPKNLSGHDVASSSRLLIAGTGKFTIKGKWHTDPLDIIHFNQFFPLTVSLIRPNGTVASSQTGFSQHVPSGHGAKLDFSYIVTAADASLSGAWSLLIKSAGTNPKIVNFDIEKGLDLNSPSFNSTFLAACSAPITVGSIDPSRQKSVILMASASSNKVKLSDGGGR